MGDVKKVGIVIDDWKLPIFERHLKQAGYTFENKGVFHAGTLVLRVSTTNVEAMRAVVSAANSEAGQTGALH